uniref:Si946054f08 n=1 Tax=Arundo donax TaxID=35708 RepID=A0A0A9H459_ARUDO
MAAEGPCEGLEAPERIWGRRRRGGRNPSGGGRGR